MMLFSELESSTLEELITAFRGSPLEGEEYRVSFYDDVADAIAHSAGSRSLRARLSIGPSSPSGCGGCSSIRTRTSWIPQSTAFGRSGIARFTIACASCSIAAPQGSSERAH